MDKEAKQGKQNKPLLQQQTKTKQTRFKGVPLAQPYRNASCYVDGKAAATRAKEREREGKEKVKERSRHTHTHTRRHTRTDTHTQTHIQAHTDTHTHRYRYSHTHTHRRGLAFEGACGNRMRPYPQQTSGQPQCLQQQQCPCPQTAPAWQLQAPANHAGALRASEMHCMWEEGEAKR